MLDGRSMLHGAEVASGSEDHQTTVHPLRSEENDIPSSVKLEGVFLPAFGKCLFSNGELPGAEQEEVSRAIAPYIAENFWLFVFTKEKLSANMNLSDGIETRKKGGKKNSLFIETILFITSGSVPLIGVLRYS